MKFDEFPKYLSFVILILFFTFLVLKAPFIYSATYGPNYENVSVDTRVNITQSKPSILLVDIEAGTSLILSAGQTRIVNCNLTVRDYNGWDDINKTNATFWDNNNVVQTAALNNNTLYRNTSCTNEGNDGQYLSYWSCSFNVLYYANNGSDWRCNATAIDAYNFTGSNYNITTIDPLYALNVTSLIDFGDMSVEDTSESSETANITNFGNMDINISLYGYGGDQSSGFANGNGLAFICEVGNITIDNEKYSLTDQAWGSMISLTNESSLLNGLTMTKRITTEVTNTTYWRLYVPPNPFGQCNGTVVFEAGTS